MKKITLCLALSLLSFYNLQAQADGRFGFTVGGSNYITESDIVFTKSQPGFSIGAVGTIEISDRFEVLVEINYTQNYTKFVGRETPTSAPQDIKFKMGNFNVPVILNYNFWEATRDLKFGVQAGPSLSFLHNYKVIDSDKEDYYLDPMYIQARDLAFDDQNEKISFNAFFAMGLSASYTENFMLNFRYYKGLTDPYRQAPFYSQTDDVKVTSKENYFTLSVIYFF